MNEAIIIPCSAADALAWAHGDKSDDEIPPAEKVEAIFFQSCPSALAYRLGGFRKVRELAKAGAVTMVCRSSLPGIQHFVTRRGGIATLREVTNDERGRLYHYRYIFPPAAFAVWMRKTRPKDNLPAGG